ncbi:hypothetical protein LMG23994_05810 [Cupriavidus pinatubonensis]|uniref:Uncharacterized protein n=1 Tax=Cupriavidus pinatubonensis TaxID=248026 RepID=A0ABM8XYU9_9BURK|nr:hypothetical protein LMG23994_05810 [Cupriavidus pinatubonensis]
MSQAEGALSLFDNGGMDKLDALPRIGKGIARAVG